MAELWEWAWSYQSSSVFGDRNTSGPSEVWFQHFLRESTLKQIKSPELAYQVNLCSQ